MNANWILSIYRIVIPLVAVMAFVNCSGSNGHDEKHQIVDLNNRYRSLIQEQFQTKSRHFNADTRYLIIVDYSIPSNSNRLFVWDTEQDEIVEKFWCAHGFGSRFRQLRFFILIFYIILYQTASCYHRHCCH